MILNNDFLKLFIGILLGGILTACLPQAKYAYKVPKIPKTYRSINENSDRYHDTINIAHINWRDFYKDKMLIQLIEQGLQYNFDVLQALKTIEIADQYYKAEKLNVLPDLNAKIAGVNYEILSEKSFASPNSTWYNEYGTPPSTLFAYKPQNYSSINLSWEIDIWGKIRSKKAAALYEYAQTKEMKKAVQTKIIAKIAEAYYNLLLLNAQLDVANENYQLGENIYRIVKLQYESANVTSLAKQQTKAQMLSYKALIPEIKRKISIQENELSFLIGGLPKNFKVEEATLWSIEIDTTLSLGIPLELIDNRPDVQAKKLELLKRNAEVGVAQTAQYPQLKIDVDFGLNAAIMRNWLNIPGALFGNVIGNLTQPVFNKRRLKTAFEVAKINREKAELDFQRETYLAVKEVSDALITITTLNEQFNIIEEQVFTTELAIRQANLLFNSGYATYIEVITAQSSALESEMKFNELRHGLLVSKIQLYKALGGGWE